MRSELFQATVDTLLTAISVEFARGTSAACRRTTHLLRSIDTTISTEPIQPVSSHDTPCSLPDSVLELLETNSPIPTVSEIAALDGVDLVALGPTDLSQTLGVTDPSDPKLRLEVERIAAEVKQAGNTKLQMPMNHPDFPLTASQLVELGVGYTNVAPQPPAILTKEMKNAVRETHKTLGRKT